MHFPSFKSYCNVVFLINGGSGLPKPGALLSYNATITFASEVPNPMIRVNNLDCECVQPSPAVRHRHAQPGTFDPVVGSSSRHPNIASLIPGPASCTILPYYDLEQGPH